MSIIEQAKRELALVNFGEDDSRVMVELLEKFFSRWDSGGAVWVAAPVLQRLIAGKALSPLTGDEDEWFDVSEHTGRPCWQNRRMSSVFRERDEAGNFRFHDLDAPGHREAITFPYWPEKAEVASPVMEIGDG